MLAIVKRYRNSILSFRPRWTSWTRQTLMGMLCGHRSISSRSNSFSSKMTWVTLKRYKTMVEARNTSVITSPRPWVSLMRSRLILSWSQLTIPTSSSSPLHREKMMFTGRPTWEVSHRQRSSSWWHLMSSFSSNNSNNITRWMSLRLMMARVAPRRKKMPLMLLTTPMLMRLN